MLLNNLIRKTDIERIWKMSFCCTFPDVIKGSVTVGDPQVDGVRFTFWFPPTVGSCSPAALDAKATTSLSMP